MLDEELALRGAVLMKCFLLYLAGAFDLRGLDLLCFFQLFLHLLHLSVLHFLIFVLVVVFDLLFG